MPHDSINFYSLSSRVYPTLRFIALLLDNYGIMSYEFSH